MILLQSIWVAILSRLDYFSEPISVLDAYIETWRNILGLT